MTNNEFADQIVVIDLRLKALDEALLEIEKSPLLWLYTKDVSSIWSFLNGWLVGRNNEQDDILLNEFSGFVAEKLGETNETLGWCNTILNHREKDNSLDLFFEIFHEYLKQ